MSSINVMDQSIGSILLKELLFYVVCTLGSLTAKSIASLVMLQLL